MVQSHTEIQAQPIPSAIPNANGSFLQTFKGEGFSVSPHVNSKVEFFPNIRLTESVGEILKNKPLRDSFAVQQTSQPLTEEQQSLVDKYTDSHHLAAEIMTNANKFHRLNTDCMSCHIASQALKYSENIFIHNFLSPFPYETTGFPVVHGAERVAQAVVSFGYVTYGGLSRVSLSDRVRTETQSSLNIVNQYFK